VRRGEDTVEPDQRVVRRRLHTEHVERRARDAAGRERLGQGSLVDDTATRTVDHLGRRLHQRQFPRADEPRGIGRERRVHGDIVRRAQQLVQADQAHAARCGAVRTHVGVVGHYLRFQPPGLGGHQTGDPAKTYQPQRLAFDFRALEAVLLPAAGFQRVHRWHHTPRQSQHQRNRLFGDRVRVPSGSVHDDNPAARGGVHIDVVHTGSGPAHDAQTRARGKQRRIDIRRRAHHQRLVLPDNAPQFLRAQPLPDFYLDARGLAQYVQPARVERLRHQYFHRALAVSGSLKGLIASPVSGLGWK